MPRYVARRPEPRIVDPATHPRRHVSLVVAAAYLEVDRKTLNKWLDAGMLSFEDRGSRRRIAVAELVDFEARQHRPAGGSVPSGNGKTDLNRETSQ